MKKTIFFVFLVLILAIISSCMTGTDITKKNKDGSPIWTTEIPKSSVVLYGVGKAKLLMDSNSQLAADAAARNDLALKINANVKEALTIYSNEASSVVVSAYETIIMQSVNLTMKNIMVEQRWTAPDGTVWSLVSFKIKNLPELYKDAANDYMNQLEEKKISTQEKLVTLLSELGSSSESDVVEMKTVAQDKANSIISEIDEILGGLDIDTSATLIELYLIQKGYELSK